MGKILEHGLEDATKYFHIFNISEDSKVKTVSIYLGEKIEIWFHRLTNDPNIFE